MTAALLRSLGYLLYGAVLVAIVVGAGLALRDVYLAVRNRCNQ